MNWFNGDGGGQSRAPDPSSPTNSPCQCLQCENQHLRAQVQGFERALAAKQDQMDKMTALLEARTVDLQAARVFLHRADNIADSDVIPLVATLNALAYQTAAAIADAHQDRRAGEKDGVAQACETLVKGGLLSKTFVDTLRRAKHDGEPFLVQVGIQAIMVAYAHRLSLAWDLWDRGTQKAYEEVYQSIRAHEPQPISAQWRILCRTHIRALRKPEDRLCQRNEEELTTQLAIVLRACGVSDSTEELHRELQAAHAGALRDFIRTAFDFRRVVGEEVVSRHMSLVSVTHGKDFDYKEMTDDWADLRKRAREEQEVGRQTVLCTTSLGLLREIEDGAKGRNARRVVLLVKPKVVLESMLASL
ncbi:uncharacterized protein BXZ73DRAFT_75738 [Epithele typhae]|uniref:uncharacterized protein n=1 Tax=Epithele typhae TaxID=378194 RepID=UPI002008217F|nr:uncharacterized protein BXZ73DRAFT_75738 [Epithele typhae]KAH9940128.1 hypothetical protein BXZ73DRAFT_75738 [Epithele typhae]